MLEILLIFFPVMIGLGAFTRLPGTGLRFAVGAFTIPLFLFIGNGLLFIPISWLSWTIIAIGSFGLLIQIREWRITGGLREYLPHPVFVFPIVLILILSFRDAIGYTPISWDELSHWISWSHKYFLADTSHHPDLAIHYTTYTRAWPLLIAAVQIPFGDFVPLRGVAMQFLLHLAVISLTWDIVKEITARELSFGARLAKATAWFIVLGLLTAEALWRFMPLDLLIERPLLYPTAALFVTSFLALLSSEHRLKLAAAMGFFLAATYSMKVTGTTVAVSAAIMCFALWIITLKDHALTAPRALTREWKAVTWYGLRLLLLILAPFLILYVSWSIIGETSKFCLTAPFKVMAEQLKAGTFFAGFNEQAPRVFGGLLSYISTYKTPITLLAVLGLITSLSHHRLWIPMVAGCFLIATVFVALSLAYTLCITDYERDTLMSLQRYFRFALRNLHYTGLIVLPLAGFALLARLAPDFANRIRRSKILPLGIILVCLPLFGFQAWSVNRSLDYMMTRANEKPEFAGTVARYTQETKALLRLIRGKNITKPSVTMVLQGTEGFGVEIARYHSITPGMKPPFYGFDLKHRFSWGPRSVNPWMTQSTPPDVSRTLRQSRIIWPGVIDDWIKPVLDGLAKQPCSGPYTDFFLIRGSDPNSAYICEPKARWLNSVNARAPAVRR